jgi:hypothetical protein
LRNFKLLSSWETIGTSAVARIKELSSSLAPKLGERIACNRKNNAAANPECLSKRRWKIHASHFSLSVPGDVWRLAANLTRVIRVVMPVLVAVKLEQREPPTVSRRPDIPCNTTINIVIAVLGVVDGVVESSSCTPAV